MIFATPCDHCWLRLVYTVGKSRFHKAAPMSQIRFNSVCSSLIVSGIRFHKNLAAHLDKKNWFVQFLGTFNRCWLWPGAGTNLNYIASLWIHLYKKLKLTSHCRRDKRPKVGRRLQMGRHNLAIRLPFFPAFLEVEDERPLLWPPWRPPGRPRRPRDLPPNLSKLFLQSFFGVWGQNYLTFFCNLEMFVYNFLFS